MSSVESNIKYSYSSPTRTAMRRATGMFRRQPMRDHGVGHVGVRAVATAPPLYVAD